MGGLRPRYFLAVGAERDIQDCRYKGRLSIAISYDEDGNLALSATEPFASRRRDDWQMSQYIRALLCSVRLLGVQPASFSKSQCVPQPFLVPFDGVLTRMSLSDGVLTWLLVLSRRFHHAIPSLLTASVHDTIATFSVGAPPQR